MDTVVDPDPGASSARIAAALAPSGHRILEAARQLLRQGEAFLATLDATTYGQRLPLAFNASIGGHFRHGLDHFECLIAGMESGLVDYDRRARDARLERDPALALRATARVRERIERLEPACLDTPVEVRCEVSYEHGDSAGTLSTVGREMVYAIAHGIHHFALIAIMARLQGVEVPPGLGMAPSTVAHLAAVERRRTTA